MHVSEKTKKSVHQSVSVQPLVKERPNDRQTSPLGRPTSLKLFLLYMPAADSIQAYSWLHHTCLQLTPSYMPASESLTDPHRGSSVLCTEVYVFCTAGYCIYLFRGFVAPSTWYDRRDLYLSGTRRGLLENKTVLVCMSHRNWLPRSLLGECLRL